MVIKQFKSAAGLTLAEVMIALATLSVAVVGTCGYRYYAALDARKAVMRRTAGDVALLLCESWRGVKGDETYDPAACFASDLPISTVYDGSVEPEDNSFTLLGAYAVVTNGVKYYAFLSWKDIGAGIRALNVVIAWPRKGQAETSIADADRSFELTTYTSH